jgi:DNA-binding PadR family transcriptional regulator
MSKHPTLEMTHYFVLLALAQGPVHGQAIAQQIIGDSVGGVYLRPSTLYATLKSLETSGLIEQSSIATAASGHIYRKSYCLTAAGQYHLADTARMHARASQLAKARLGLRY